jgi:predicted nucleic acid-binding protein
MSFTIFLDAGPLSLVTNPKRTPDSVAATEWVIAMIADGRRFIVPAIADYEVRRELIRAGKARGLAQLDAFNNAAPGRFLSVTDNALQLAARLWAQARNTGAPTADPKELDGDVLIAAQVISVGLSPAHFTVATTNLAHLSQFVPSDLWKNIRP